MNKHLLLSLLCALCISVASSPTSAALQFDMSDRLADLEIDADGNVVVETDNGLLAVPPSTFIQAVSERQSSGGRRGPTYQLLDITGPLGFIWVGLGLLGQVLFTGRMVVQWLASEKAKQSVVPPAFWWMSFSGATLLLAYFTWRVDIVGILGQLTGWAIYVRNLWLIYRPAASTIAPA